MKKQNSKLKNELIQFKNSFKAFNNKKLWIILLIEIILIITLVIGMTAWKESIQTVGPLAKSVGTSGAQVSAGDLFALQPHTGSITKIYYSMIGYTFLLLLFLLLIVPLFKLQIYRKLTNQSISLKRFWKFVLFSVVWNILALVFIYLIQALLYFPFINSIATNKLSQTVFLAIISIAIFFVFYLTVNFFSSFVTKKTFKESWIEFKPTLKTLNWALLRIFFILLVFAVTNLLMLIFIQIPGPKIFFFAASLLLLIFITWARIYVYSCKTVKNKKKHKKRKNKTK